MKGRKPSRSELALWRKVARTAHPIDGSRLTNARGGDATETAGAGPGPLPTRKDHPPIAPFRIGSLANSSPATESQAARSVPAVRMDKKAFGRMVRGRLSPEARIDLHGMTQDEAQLALATFVLGKQAEGKRLVLVITGKGRRRMDNDPIPSRPGILRRLVPDWLRRPPLDSVVLQVTPAHARHGGTGAYYVYLRRSRK